MRAPARLCGLGLAVLLGAAAPTAQAIVDAAPPSAWQRIQDDDLLVMTLGNGARVVIQLAPEFAPVHVANIRRLAQAGWWNGARIVRVQDNYVVQWSQPEDRKLPAGVVARPPAEYELPAKGLAIHRLSYPDTYAPIVGFADGWPVASDGRAAWLVHCYGMVGVGRDLPPDTGSGAELYAVIGQAPRHLDRNIALVGRVVEGMPALASLPRGTEALGFYAHPAEGMRITRVTLGGTFEAMRVDDAYLDARANRRDPFFVRPAGAVDVCNAPVPVREVK